MNLQPVGAKAQEFLEQLGVLLAQGGQPIQETTIRIKMDTPVAGETVGSLARDVAQTIGLQWSDFAKHLILRENDTVLDVGRLRELGRYSGIGNIPISAPYR